MHRMNGVWISIVKRRCFQVFTGRRMNLWTRAALLTLISFTLSNNFFHTPKVYCKNPATISYLLANASKMVDIILIDNSVVHLCKASVMAAWNNIKS